MDKISGLNGDKKMENNDENQTNKTNTVPFHKLFSFADSTDILLMIVGTIGAVGNGICPPLMTVLFGELVNAFGENQTKDVVDVVSKVIFVLPFSFFLDFSTCEHVKTHLNYKYIFTYLTFAS